MGSTSVTGQGSGPSRKPTTNELAIYNNAPAIIFAGYTNVEPTGSPPSTPINGVTFPYPLEGGPDNYVVILTSLNGGAVYVVSREEDDDGNFTGFLAAGENECDVMYIVTKVGVRPNLGN